LQKRLTGQQQLKALLVPHVDVLRAPQTPFLHQPEREVDREDDKDAQTSNLHTKTGPEHVDCLVEVCRCDIFGLGPCSTSGLQEQTDSIRGDKDDGVSSEWYERQLGAIDDYNAPKAEVDGVT